MTAFGQTLFLSGNDLAQRSGEICLHKDVTDFRHCTIGKEDAFGVSPFRENRRASFDLLHAQLIDRETIGEFNCRLHDFAQGFCTKLIERGDAGVEYGGDGRGEWAGRWNQARLRTSHCRHVCSALRGGGIGSS